MNRQGHDMLFYYAFCSFTTIVAFGCETLCYLPICYQTHGLARPPEGFVTSFIYSFEKHPKSI
jgi:hypothetical protein